MTVQDIVKLARETEEYGAKKTFIRLKPPVEVRHTPTKSDVRLSIVENETVSQPSAMVEGSRAWYPITEFELR